MKQVKKDFVEVPRTTLNALKNLLFGNEGVDMSAIVDDLNLNPADRDITAINVALAYKGVPVEVDTTTRYEKHFGNHFTKHEYVGVSIIHGLVKVKSTSCFVHEDGSVREQEQSSFAAYGFNQWNEFTTDREAVILELSK